MFFINDNKIILDEISYEEERYLERLKIENFKEKVDEIFYS